MIQSSRLPRSIQRGTDQVLTLELRADDGEAEITPSAATVTVHAGSTVVATLTATPGVTTTATLLGATTADLALGDDWLEVWSVTVDSVVHQVQRSASLVRRLLYPSVTVADLKAQAPHIARIYADLPTLLRVSWEHIQRDLMLRGNRPALILEPSALHDPHVSKALHIAYETAVQQTGDDRFTRQASRYRDQYDRQMGGLAYRYDSDEDGADTEDDRAATSAVLWGSMPPRARGRY